MVVDCLFVLLCDVQGCVVGVVYVGWCGFVVGIVEQMVVCVVVFVGGVMDVLYVYFGLVIGLQVFEVGVDVCDVFFDMVLQLEYDEICYVFVVIDGVFGKFLVDFYVFVCL